MIVVKLFGGLGNQLFQYAAARRLALVNNVSLKLDITKLANDRLRAYRLGYFNVKAQLATSGDIMRAKGGTGIKGKFIRRFESLRLYHRHHWVKEPHYHFDPNILKVSSNAFLEGYWQSEKYFKDIQETLREELTLQSQPSVFSEQIAQTILSTASVSLHVRRSDYVTDSTTHQIYGVCSLEYYNAAIAKIKRQVDNPHFFIFSDDPVWTKRNLTIKDPTTFVTHNGAERDYEDLWLMSRCKHNIIANSSFSWWGAWLNSHPAKIVIAPKQWAKNPAYNHHDRFPQTWETL